MKTIHFFAPGIPKGQPRARAVRRGKHAGMYDPGTADNWKSSVRAAVKEVWDGVVIEGPVSVDITAVFPRPKSHFFTGRRANVMRKDAPTYHTAKPDKDNIDKAIYDALTNAGIWKDDSMVCVGGTSKIYGDRPGASIIIQTLD